MRRELLLARRQLLALRIDGRDLLVERARALGRLSERAGLALRELALELCEPLFELGEFSVARLESPRALLGARLRLLGRGESSGKLGLARGQTLVALVRVALRLGLVNRPLQLCLRGEQAHDLGAGVVGSGLRSRELVADLVEVGVALAGREPRCPQLVLTLPQLLLEAVEGLTARALGLATALELGLARGERLLEQRGAISGRLQLVGATRGGADLRLELAAHVCDLALRELEIDAHALDLRLHPGAGRERLLPLGVELAERVDRLRELLLEARDLGDEPAAARLGIVQKVGLARELRLQADDRAVALGERVRDRVELLVTALQQRLDALELGARVARGGEVGDQPVALGAGVFQCSHALFEQGARLVELATVRVKLGMQRRQLLAARDEIGLEPDHARLQLVALALGGPETLDLDPEAANLTV